MRARPNIASWRARRRKRWIRHCKTSEWRWASSPSSTWLESTSAISPAWRVAQRKPSAEEIRERCLYAMINEGARVLEEGIAFRASDIDVVYTSGYGFP